MIEEEQHSVHDDEETMDLFAEYYRPAEMTEIDGLYQKTMPTSTKYVTCCVYAPSRVVLVPFYGLCSCYVTGSARVH